MTAIKYIFCQLEATSWFMFHCFIVLFFFVLPHSCQKGGLVLLSPLAIAQHRPYVTFWCCSKQKDPILQGFSITREDSSELECAQSFFFFWSEKLYE